MKTIDYRTTSTPISTVAPLSEGTIVEVRRIESDNLIKTGFFTTSITIAGNVTPFFTDEKGVTHEIPNTFSFSGFECYRAKEGYFNLLLVTKNAFLLEFTAQIDNGYDTRITRNSTGHVSVAFTVRIKDTDAFLKAFPISKGTKITVTDVHSAVSDGVNSVLRTVLRSCKSQRDFIRKSKGIYSIFNSIGLYCSWIDCQAFHSAYEDYYAEKTKKIETEKEKRKEYLRKLIQDNAEQIAVTVAKGLEVRQPSETLDAAVARINQVYADAKREIDKIYEEEKSEYTRDTRRLPLVSNSSALLADQYGNNYGYHNNHHHNYRKPALASGGSSNHHTNTYHPKNTAGNSHHKYNPSNNRYGKPSGGNYYFVKPVSDDEHKKRTPTNFADSYEKSTFYGDKGYDE